LNSGLTCQDCTCPPPAVDRVEEIRESFAWLEKHDPKEFQSLIEFPKNAAKCYENAKYLLSALDKAHAEIAFLKDQREKLADEIEGCGLNWKP
jgi:hypothetical protein